MSLCHFHSKLRIEGVSYHARMICFSFKKQMSFPPAKDIKMKCTIIFLRYGGSKRSIYNCLLQNLTYFVITIP